MGRLVAAMDVSGDQYSGNHKFLAVVIGTEEKINAIVKNLGNNKIHMSMIKSKSIKDRIISEVVFDGKESIAFCLRIDMKHILEPVKSKRTTRRRTGQSRMYRIYYRAVIYLIRRHIENFLASHHYAIHDIYFQCDDDCRNMIKYNGLKHDRPGSAHDLADIVAWANNRCTEPEGVVSINLTEEIKDRLKKTLQS